MARAGCLCSHPARPSAPGRRPPSGAAGRTRSIPRGDAYTVRPSPAPWLRRRLRARVVSSASSTMRSRPIMRSTIDRGALPRRKPGHVDATGQAPVGLIHGAVETFLFDLDVQRELARRQLGRGDLHSGTTPSTRLRIFVKPVCHGWCARARGPAPSRAESAAATRRIVVDAHRHWLAFRRVSGGCAPAAPAAPPRQ